MVANCKLCLKEKELMFSHIIPEYFYEPMYDEKHRFMQISTIPEIPIKHKQKGIREYLLCEECEQKFSVFERYVSQAYYHKESNKIQQDERIFVVEDVDYKLLKLFQLSILWRSAITNVELFGDVKLGPHTERLRLMLFNEDPGKDYEYGCLQFAVIFDQNKLADGLIMPPALFRVDGYRMCRFTFGGIIWLYVISSHNNQFRWKEFFLLESGKLTIFKKFFEDIKFLMNFGYELELQGKFEQLR
jgi:hypothetical protein